MNYRLEMNIEKPFYKIQHLPDGKPRFVTEYRVFDKKTWDFQGDIKFEENDKVDLSDVDSELGELWLSDVLKMPDGYKLKTCKTIRLGDVDIDKRTKLEGMYGNLLDEYNKLGWLGRLKNRIRNL